MKRVMVLILAVIMVLGLSGCEKSRVTSESMSSDLGTLVAMQKSPEKIATSFVSALLEKDYELALKTFALSKESFVQADDVKWYLPRSSFADIENIDYEEYDVSAEVSSRNDLLTTVAVTIKNTEDEEDSRSFTVKTTLSKDNLWTVDGSEFYYENFSFRAPGGKTVVLLNNKAVPDSLCVDVTNNGGKEYKIPCVGKKDVTIYVSSDNFNYSKDITPSEDNEIKDEQKIYPPIEDSDAALAFIKNTWNSAYSEYVGGCKESDFQKYISSSADVSICKTMYDGYATLTKNNSNLSADRDENHLVTQCVLDSSDNAYWLTDSVCYIRFNYELTWHYVIAKWSQNMKVADADMYLNFENGEFKIQVVSTPDVFSTANEFCKEW